MRKASKKNKSIQSRINRLLEIPQEISTNLPKITVIGFKQMLIENYKGILEYQDFYIRISTHIGILNINGYDLYLEEMTTDDLLVTGKIESIDFETITDEDVAEWHSVIDKMVYAFDKTNVPDIRDFKFKIEMDRGEKKANGFTQIFLNCDNEVEKKRYYEALEEHHKKCEEGRMLFAKYYENLWY